MSADVGHDTKPTTRRPPTYFEEVRQKAHARWNQLEADPELAGPWKLLFSQVQSPRHVLSELLQNADDAGAKTATARIVNDLFVFTHDGEDFNQDQFESLCRFGFSNKRTLHTIGFRGIGFKSTFSLGDSVEVWTPSLAIRFSKDRFTEPIWLDDAIVHPQTWIRVRIQDHHREAELKKNLEDWAQSPVSLIFFSSIQKLIIAGQVIEKRVLGPGPVPNSERVEIVGKSGAPFTIFRSPEEEFPADAIREIRLERNTTDLNLPPCHVEILVGLTGVQRLFVVLPTGVTPNLPFSCNAPFLQDPARSGIKDLAISPTNRWLLNRIGNLARTSMESWLSDQASTVADRAHAYALLSTPPADSDNLNRDCANEVSEGFSSATDNTAVLLTVDGRLVRNSACLAPPAPLYRIWEAKDIVTIFGTSEQCLLAREVTDAAREKLKKWSWLELFPWDRVCERLKSGNHPPRPTMPDGLQRLWLYVQSEMRWDPGAIQRKKLRIVPVAGHECLFDAENVIRPPTNPSSLQPEDWVFLSNLISAVDTTWLRELTADKANSSSSLALAVELLHAIGLDGASPWEKVFEHASKTLLAQSQVMLSELVQLAHVMAALNVQAPRGFNYGTRDCFRRDCDSCLIWDPTSEVEDLVPDEWAAEHLLHDDYAQRTASCSRETWNIWAASEKSGLRTGVPLIQTEKKIWGLPPLREFLRVRGQHVVSDLPYRRTEFIVRDVDFPEPLLMHWEELSKSDPTFWPRILRSIAADPKRQWSAQTTVSILQSGTSYSKSVGTLGPGPLPAAWVVRFRKLSCLPDTYGRLHEPAELLMRTPDTEPLIGVEPFVRTEDDTEWTKPLLKLLGVRDTPTGLDKLIDRIRSLTTVENPPVHEVAKWYDALDRVLVRCRPYDLAQAQRAFSAEPLILTSDGTWAGIGDIFLEAEELSGEDVALVHPAVRALSMWSRLGVAERPDADLVVNWLRKIPADQKLEPKETARIRALIRRYPIRIWQDCQRWLSLEGTWASTADIGFQVSMQRLAKFADLFPSYKARTADLRMLTAEICDRPPFIDIAHLGSAITYRLTERDRVLPAPVEKPWLRELAQSLWRIRLGDAEQMQHVRSLATCLAASIWQPFRVLRVTPYIEGTPAGQPYSPDVLWDDQTFYIQDRPLSKLFNSMVAELAQPFKTPQVADAIRACAERDVLFVREYMEENFDLDSELQPDTSSAPGARVSGEDSDESSDGSPVDGGDDGEGGITENQHGPETETPSLDQEAPEIQEPGPPLRPTRDRQPRPPNDPTLIARYAATKGYRWSSSRNRFVHADGSWLQKSDGGGFNWERYSANGEVACRYWVSEQCLDNGGIEIAAELWEMIKRSPKLSGLILAGIDDDPEEFLGTELVSCVEHDALHLFPAKYRIRKST